MVYSLGDVVIIITASLLIQPSSSQKFDPYQLNGGLVTAVAGKDYVLIASDTRLTDGGYGIKSRNYLSGRIWSAHSTFTSSLASPSSSSYTASSLQLENDEDHDGDTSPLTLRRISTDTLWESDGSLIVSSNNNVVNDRSSETTTLAQTQIMDMDKINSYTTHTNRNRKHSNSLPIMIGSAGCASDCEALKRRMRLELDALLSSSNSYSSRIEVQSVANLLQQILYGRRTFPFYSFCVVAGIDTRGVVRGGRGETGGVGAVYVYDAIGSYERVAVACAGTGRELLQPVLDRLFSSSQQQPRQRRKRTVPNDEIESSRVEEVTIDETDEEIITTIPAEKQQMGIAGSLRPPVITHVSCPWQEAVRNVAHAYMSVAEREISVGDEVVICVVNASSDNKVGGGNEEVVNVFRYPLKKH